MTDTKGRIYRTEKVEDLKSKVKGAKSIVFTEYQGLSASKIADLRSKLRDAGAETSVAKNKLLEIALGEKKIKLTGPTMTVFSYEDAVATIKLLFDFAEENEERPVIKSGFVEGNLVDLKTLRVLSELPGRDQLIAQVVGGLKSPLSSIVGVLGGVQRNFVYAMAAIAKAKEQE